jgi:glucose-6-phosphate-specific signal transduction histidine kinase
VLLAVSVQGLRISTIGRNDLAVAIRALGDELATDASTERPRVFRVAVEGQTRDLHPIICDDIYRIAAEALRNAFRHAHAEQEVEIHYDDEQFRLRVRDNGNGSIPRYGARQGIEGHFGLRGMSEGASLIGGTLPVWSEVGTGTEVELPPAETSRRHPCSARGGRGSLPRGRRPEAERHHVYGRHRRACWRRSRRSRSRSSLRSGGPANVES